MPKTGVLLVGFGGPDSLDAVAPFMRNLMGREPSEELVQRVSMRYLTIGGRSPLPAIAEAIAGKLSTELARTGEIVPVEVGMRYWDPYIEDALARLKAAGCERIVTVSLSPFESVVAQQAYRDAIAEAVEKLGGLEIVEAPLISELPYFATYLAGSTSASIMDLEPNEGAIIAFTAHSLPESDLTEDDAYVSGLRTVASHIALELGLEEGADGAGEPMFDDFRAFGSAKAPRAWFLVYQSKGNKPGSWLGPDLDDLIRACAERGIPSIVVCPIGFATDHMETLYDLDVVAAGEALDAGLEFARAQVPNDDDEFVKAIGESIASIIR